MATDFSGTNTERIDKLAAAVVDIRAEMRVIKAVFVIVFPFLVLFCGFLATESYRASSRLDRSGDRLDRIEHTLEKIEGRFDRFEASTTQIERATDLTGERTARLEKSLESLNAKFDTILTKLDPAPRPKPNAP